MKNTVDFINKNIVLIDQTKLPRKFILVKIRTWQECIHAIKTMVVRGAPAIGVTGALGVVLAAYQLQSKKTKTFIAELKEIAKKIEQARPTAVNLRWGVERMLKLAQDNQDLDVKMIVRVLEAEAKAVIQEDININKSIGKNGLSIFKQKATVLTHCNAGALATVAYGTALGVIRAGWAKGKIKQVYADETRPRLQGGKLTAWELTQDKIPVTVITDSMAGYIMQQGKIDLVVVGADRIASNGDTCNKIGTYSVAVLAKEHNIPFYIAAPVSTIDFRIASGKEIPIEEREHEEVTHVDGKRILAQDIKVLNPAFDVTPARLITGIITEKGLFKPEDLTKQILNENTSS